MRYPTLLIWMMACLLTACNSINTPNDTPADDADAPVYAWDFTLDSLQGETYTLSDLRGQWVVINFWATWCIPCRDEMPELQAISEIYADDLIMLGINQRETAEIAMPFVEELGVTFPILMNPSTDTLRDYQIIRLPLTFIVDPRGELAYRHAGPLTVESFEAIFNELQTN
ncbi:MAG: TlpA disulfide reductase family protein, partial [Chloroflexota bacterium]